MNLKAAKKKITNKAIDIFIPGQTAVIHFRTRRRRHIDKDCVVKATDTPQGMMFTFENEPYLVAKSMTSRVTKCIDCKYCNKNRELTKKRTAKKKRPEILEDFNCTCYNNCTEVGKDK